jgi:chromosomal replication initiator protein
VRNAQLDAVHDVWMTCQDMLRQRLSAFTWQTLVACLEPVAITEDRLVLRVPNTYVRDRLQERYAALLSSVASATLRRAVDIALEVDPGPRPSLGSSAQSELAREPTEAPDASKAARTMPGRTDDGLDPRYTFDAFVIGSSNRFAHAAALSVAEAPARSYNPLFIHGGVGLGKTHLLHAVGNYIRQTAPNTSVRYVSTETFMNEFVDAIRTNTQSAFKRRYRECEVLLIDDVQFLERKEQLQEEFFHTFNHLHGLSRQIVLTSDRPPRAIATLETRLRSRFLSGLITDIQPPELETRIAILRKKAEREPLPIPDDVLEFIATHVTDNIRELEGALIRVVAYASLNAEALTKFLAEHVLADIVAAERAHQVTPQLILSTTAEAFGLSVADLCGPSRRRPLVTARQIGMYVCRELTDLSYPAIAREFGGRDHTTVMHAVEKIASQMRERRHIYELVTSLIMKIRARA